MIKTILVLLVVSATVAIIPINHRSHSLDIEDIKTDQATQFRGYELQASLRYVERTPDLISVTF